MRILTKGKVPGEVPQQATCQHCKTVHEFVPNEVARVSDQRDGDFYQFPCMLCKASVTVPVNLKGM